MCQQLKPIPQCARIIPILVCLNWAAVLAQPAAFSVSIDSSAAAESDSLPNPEAKAGAIPDTSKTDSSARAAGDSLAQKQSADEIEAIRNAAAAASPEFPKAKVASGLQVVVQGFRGLCTSAIRSGLLQWLASRLLHLLILAISIAIIFCTVLFYRRREDAKPRFLTTTRLSIMDKEVQRACRYIEKNFANPDLTPQSICTDLITGEAFLEALFERDLGMSLVGFIDQVRTNRAKVLLHQDPGMSAEDLSVACGYNDSAMLQRAFEKASGMTLEAFCSSH